MSKLDTLLKALLKERGIKKKYVIYDVMQITYSSYYNWRDDLERFPIQPLKRLAVYFGMSLDELLDQVKE